MEYSVNKLAKLSGVSARTLRYYDEIGLLKPLRVASSGYRIYGAAELDLLQQILFFRELGFSLETIKSLLRKPEFDREAAFKSHLSELRQKRKKIDLLIGTVTKSLAAMKGELTMTESEKFEGFKQSLIDKNEETYGKEVREKYGDAAVDQSNAALKGMTKEGYNAAEELRLEMEKTLKDAFETGDAAGALAQKACDLHRQWLSAFYPAYSREYHMGLGEMYVADDRFRANYDKIAPGCTEFLCDAINHYCREA